MSKYINQTVYIITICQPFILDLFRLLAIPYFSLCFRYCISAALAVLDRHKCEDKAAELEGDDGNKSRRSEAVVDRHCVKYALTLLEYSHCASLQVIISSREREREREGTIDCLLH